MADTQPFSTLPTDTPTPWLARNRKIVILGGLVVVLGVVVAMVVWRGPLTPKGQNSTTNNDQVNINTGLTTQPRPTFQRSTVTNTPTTLPPSYRPPSTDDLRKAITNLNSSTTSKP